MEVRAQIFVQCLLKSSPSAGAAWRTKASDVLANAAHKSENECAKQGNFWGKELFILRLKLTKKIESNKTNDPWEEQLKLLVLLSLYVINLILAWQLKGSFFVWTQTWATDELIWVLNKASVHTDFSRKKCNILYSSFIS